MAKTYTKRADGRYCVSITIGHDINGKAVKKMLYAKTKKELSIKVEALEKALQVGSSPINSDILFLDYAQHWLDVYKNKKELATREMYKQALNHCYLLFDMPMINIVQSDIQIIINENYSHPHTCRQILLTLKQVFKSAISDKVIMFSPINNVNVPKITKSTRRHALSDEERNKIFQADFEPMERAFVFTLFGCGLRRGEALALLRSDIDFDNNVIHVTKSLAFDTNGNRAYIKDCKTDNSTRIVPMPASLSKILKLYVNERSFLTDKLFTKADNKHYMSPSAYRRFWDNIRGKTDCHELTAYSFRHNYATELYYSDISIKKASELMGHTDTKMIMNVYAHLDESRENTQEKIDKIMNF